MGMEHVDVRIPEVLIEKADAAAKITHNTRTEIMIEALRTYLDDIEEQDDFKKAVIDRYLADEIEFEMLTEFLGRQDAEAVRSSKDILDQVEDLADEMSDH